MTGAQWDDDARRWTVETDQGDVSARVLISAAGALSEPSTPDIEGIDDFQGHTFHSARWDHDYDLEGKRVAVIGTGASAIQFVPTIAPKVAQMHVFQRTAPWIMPHSDRPDPPRSSAACTAASRCCRSWSAAASTARASCSCSASSSSPS